MEKLGEFAGEVVPRRRGYQLRMRFQSDFSGQVTVAVCSYRTLVIMNPLFCQGTVKAELSANTAFCSSSHLKLLRALPGKTRVW